MPFDLIQTDTVTFGHGRVLELIYRNLFAGEFS
jgi:hypothetical protein